MSDHLHVVEDESPIPDAELDLGHGYRADWITEGDHKAGILLYHSCGVAPLFWEDVGERRPLFELQNLDPLFLLPHVTCPSCGDKGWVRGTRWVPFDDRPDALAVEAVADSLAHEFRHFARATPDTWQLAAEASLLRALDAGWAMMRV